VRLLDLDAGKLDRQPYLVELGFDMRAVFSGRAADRFGADACEALLEM